MTKKLLIFAAVAFVAFLPLPFVMDYSYLFGGGYIAIAVMICGATWGQLNRGNHNAN